MPGDLVKAAVQAACNSTFTAPCIYPECTACDVVTQQKAALVVVAEWLNRTDCTTIDGAADAIRWELQGGEHG